MEQEVDITGTLDLSWYMNLKVTPREDLTQEQKEVIRKHYPLDIKL